MKIQDVITYCENNQIPYEVHGASTNLKHDFENWDSLLRSLDWSHLTIGFEFKNHVWYWFRWLDDNFECDHPLFIERYNRNNGASQKSFTKGWECEKEIQKYIENKTDESQQTKLNSNLNKRTMKITKNQIEKMTAVELRKLGSSAGIKGAGKMKKEDLLKALSALIPKEDKAKADEKKAESKPKAETKKTSTSTSTKKDEKKPKVKPVNNFMDELLVIGGTWEEMIPKVNAYAKKTKAKRVLKSGKQFTKHIKYRRTVTKKVDFLKGYTITDHGCFKTKKAAADAAKNAKATKKETSKK